MILDLIPHDNKNQMMKPSNRKPTLTGICIIFFLVLLSCAKDEGISHEDQRLIANVYERSSMDDVDLHAIAAMLNAQVPNEHNLSEEVDSRSSAPETMDLREIEGLLKATDDNMDR